MWREEDGIIYLSVTSDGTTGPDWIDRLERDERFGQKGFGLCSDAEKLIGTMEFVSTTGVEMEIAILKGSRLVHGNRTLRQVYEESFARQYASLTVEAACLVRVAVTDEDIAAMGLQAVVVMHEPAYDQDHQFRYVIEVPREKDDFILDVYPHYLDEEVSEDTGFAFLVPKARSA